MRRPRVRVLRTKTHATGWGGVGADQFCGVSSSEICSFQCSLRRSVA